MTADLDPDALVCQMSLWLLTRPAGGKNVIGELRSRFGATVTQAVAACRRAHQMRAREATHAEAT